MRSTNLLLLCVATALAAPGCGSSHVPVTGKILRGGQPYQPPEGQKLAVTLYAIELSGDDGQTAPGLDEPFPAQVRQEDGTFVVPGPDGAGVPRGSYRVAIRQRYTREQLDAPDAPKGPRGQPIDRETDLLKDRFGPQTSPLVHEVAGPAELVIDLDETPDDGQADASGSRAVARRRD